jgi:hypothetical protein
MDTKQIRLANINHLANKHGRDRIAECDTRKKWTANYINQLCGGFGSFGAVTARRIEKGLNLSHGWMDLLHPEVSYQGDLKPLGDTADKAKIISLWEQMTPEQRAQLLKIGIALSEK